MFSFGAGFVFANPLGGNRPTLATPQQFGTVQDASVDFAQEFKELQGAMRVPDDVVAGKMKITGKVKFGKIEIDTLNQIMFGETSTTTGIEVVMPNEQLTVPTTPFAVNVANKATFVSDLGVLYHDTKALFQRTTSNVSAGQYSVSAGTYTFSTTDASKSVDVSYVYTDSANGKTLSVINHPLGFGPYCELFLTQPYQGNNALRLYAVRFGKLSVPIKNDDYTIPELDFEAYADASGQIFKWYQVSN